MKNFFNFICSSVNERRIIRRMNSDIKSELKHEKNNCDREVKLLLLGTGQSGKSTFIKQMRIIHGNSYNDRERCSFIPQIHIYTVLVAKSLADSIKKSAICFEDDESVKNCEFISSEHGCEDTSVYSRLSEQLIGAITCLWKDKNVQSVYLRRDDCDFDSAKYFLDSLVRISSPDYIPCDQDILRVRTPTTGVEEYSFKLESMTLRIIDVGGQRGEREKWIHCFDSVTSIIFLASLCEYDQLLDADSERPSRSSVSSTSTRSPNDRNTRMEVSLALFSTIVSYPGFSETSFILFLNKKDVFEQKILNSHLSTFYPEFTGPKSDATSASEFIQDLYLTRCRQSARMIGYTGTELKKETSVDRVVKSSPRHQRWRRTRHQSSNSHALNCNQLSPDLTNPDRRCSHCHGRYIYTHFTAATDTENMRRVFSSVKDTILRRNIEDCLL